MPKSKAVVAARENSHLGAELESLASALENTDIGPGAAQLVEDRDRLVFAIRSYLMPRLDDPARPLVVAFTGPTGSGKSTLVNSLTGREVSQTGPVRPTTTKPIVLASEHNLPVFESVGGVSCDVVAGAAPVLESTVLIDTPDIDSTSRGHRIMAEALIDVSDVVVFVTSSLRYADDVAWQVLRRAQARGIDVVAVLNRVGADTAGAVVDYKSRLRRQGLGDEIVMVPDHRTGEGGQIPSLAVRSLARRLATVAAGRAETSSSTLRRVLDVTLRQVGDLARAVSDLDEEADEMMAETSLSLADHAARLDLSSASLRPIIDVPLSGGRWAKLRWRLRNRMDDETIGHFSRGVVDRVGALIQGDIRSWAADHGVGMSSDLGSVPRAIESEIESWVGYIARMASGRDIAEPLLLQAALLQSVLGGDTSAVGLLAGPDADGLIGRARRELETRVGVIYDRVATQVADAHRRRIGGLDDADLRTAWGVAMAAALVDA